MKVAQYAILPLPDLPSSAVGWQAAPESSRRFLQPVSGLFQKVLQQNLWAADLANAARAAAGFMK